VCGLNRDRGLAASLSVVWEGDRMAATRYGMCDAFSCVWAEP